LPSCGGLDGVPFRRRSFAPVQEALNGVQMTLSLGGENVTVLDLDADFAAELAGLIEVGSQPADVAGSRPI